MKKLVHSVLDISGGEITAVTNEKIPVNGAKLLQNFLIEIDGTLSKRDKQTKLTTFTDDARVYYAIDHIDSNNARYKVVALDDGRVFYKTTSSEWTEITETGVFPPAGFGTASTVRMFSFEGNLWLVDGANIFYWDATTPEVIDATASLITPANLPGYPTRICGCQGVLWFGGFIDSPSRLHHSRFYDDSGNLITSTSADAWSNVAAQFFEIDRLGEIIVGIADFNNTLIIFTKTSVYAMVGYIANISPRIQKILSDDGLYDDKTIVNVGGNLYFLGTRGVYVIDPSLNIKIVSTAIEDYFKDLTQTDVYYGKYLADSEAEFSEYTLDNGTAEDKKNYIVPLIVPHYSDDVSAMLKQYKTHIISGDTTGYGYSKRIEFHIVNDGRIIDGNSYFRFWYKCLYLSNSGYSMTLDILKNDIRQFINTSVPLVADGNLHCAVVAITGVTFDFSGSDVWTVKIGERTSMFSLNEFAFPYDIHVKNSSWIQIKDQIDYWTPNPDELTPTEVHESATGRLYWFGIFPELATYTSPVLIADNITEEGQIFVDYDPEYFEDTTNNKIYYRYGATEAACLAASWTEIENGGLPDLGASGVDVYYQIKVVSYLDETNTDDPCIFDGFPVIEAIRFVYYNASAIELNFWAAKWKNRYVLSMAEKGIDNNRKVYILNDGGGWSHFLLYANALWEQDGLLTFGKSISPDVYQLTKDDVLVSERWDSEAEFENYYEDDNCDAETESGLLQSLLAGTVIGLLIDYLGDNWTKSQIGNYTYSVLTSESVLFSGNGLGGAGLAGFELQKGVVDFNRTAQNIKFEVDLSDMMELDYTTDGANDGASIYVIYASMTNVGLLFRNWKEWDVDHWVYKISYLIQCYDGMIGMVYNSNYTTISGTLGAFEVEVNRAGNTVNVKVQALAIDVSFSVTSYSWGTLHEDYIGIGIDVIKTDATFNKITFSSDKNVYPATAFRIYRYTSGGTINLKVKADTASATNYINIYNALRAEEPGVYEWNLLETITDANETDISFESTTTKYLKVEFVNSDTSATGKLDYIKVVSGESVEAIYESGNITTEAVNVNKIAKRVQVMQEGASDIDFYIKTDNMVSYKHKEVDSLATHSLPCIKGKSFKVKIIEKSTNKLRLKGYNLEYFEENVI